MNPNKDSLILILIFVSAFFLRIYWAGDYFGEDEIYRVGHAVDIFAEGKTRSVFPPFFYYLLVPLIAIFGESERVMHILAASLGAVTVSLVYYVGKKLLSFWIGLIASVLLMFSTTHWFFSNFAMLDVPITLFSLISLYFYWVGYERDSGKHMLTAAAFGSMAILTKYGFFAPVAMLVFLLLFDRKSLRNKRLVPCIIAPLVIFGLWMLYFVTQQRMLWNWWSNYIQEGGGVSSPFYQYLAATYYEFLLPIPLLFFVFLSLYLLNRKHGNKLRYPELIFLSAFVAASAYFILFEPTLEQEALLGFFALTCIMVYHSEGRSFNKLLIVFIISIFLFFSFLELKFDRYILPALPALYILVAQLVYDVRKNRYVLGTCVVVIALFTIYNSANTVSELNKVNLENSLRFQAQGYIADNTRSCSEVYSDTWYGLYYLRNRASELPRDLEFAIKSSCNCPPRYFVSEGPLEVSYVDKLQEEKSFTGEFERYSFDMKYGLRTDKVPVTPILVYSTNSTMISNLCRPS